MEKVLKETMTNACKYYMDIEKVEEKNYEQSKSILNELLDAHGMALGILHQVIISKNKEPGKTDEKISNKLLQISVFYQGIVLCEKAIRNAQYNAAAALVRQEYEIICNLHEIDDESQRTGKGPNAKSGLDGFGQHFGILSKLTHVVGNEWTYLYKKEELMCDEDIKPITLFPVTDTDACLDLYGKHILFILVIIIELSNLFSEMYDTQVLSDEMLKVLTGVFSILEMYDIVKRKE